MSNAIKTIDNEMICFIIYCLNCIRHGRNATYERGLRCSNERSTKFESLNHKYKFLEEENGKMVALQMSPKIESLYGFSLDRVCMEFCNF